MGATLKELFLKLYANVPLSERDNAIYNDATHGPVSWKVIYQEVSQDTPFSVEILKVLVQAGTLKV